MTSYLLKLLNKIIFFWEGRTTIKDPMGSIIKTTDAEFKQALAYGGGLLLLTNLTQASTDDPEAADIVPLPPQIVIGTDVEIAHARADEGEFTATITGLTGLDVEKVLVEGGPEIVIGDVDDDEGDLVINYTTADTNDGFSAWLRVSYFG